MSLTLFRVEEVEGERVVAYLNARFKLNLDIYMCPLGDIMDISDSCDEKVGFFITGSSVPICPLSETVLNLSLACSSTELHSVTD